MVELLEKIYKSNIIVFEDSSFLSIDDIIHYYMRCFAFSYYDAFVLAYSRNFCDRRDVLNLYEIGLVEETGANYPTIAYKISGEGLKLLRDIKIDLL
jgi:hypothetical protein